MEEIVTFYKKGIVSTLIFSKMIECYASYFLFFAFLSSTSIDARRRFGGGHSRGAERSEHDDGGSAGQVQEHRWGVREAWPNRADAEHSDESPIAGW